MNKVIKKKEDARDPKFCNSKCITNDMAKEYDFIKNMIELWKILLIIIEHNCTICNRIHHIKRDLHA